MKDKQNGITLVALVITIIILLILAGISIATLTNSGLFENARKAETKNLESMAEEEIKLLVYETMLENGGKATLKQIVQKLDEDTKNTYIVTTKNKTAKLVSQDGIGITDIDQITEETEAIYVTNTKYGHAVGVTSTLDVKLEKTENIPNIPTEPTIPVTSYTITKNLSEGISIDNTAEKVEENKPYQATIAASEGYILKTLTVTMGGESVSVELATGVINIQKVTGDIVITATGEQKPDPTVETNPATSIAEAQADYMLEKEVNSPIQDGYGNKIVVPAGFKITTEATTVNQGIVIEDGSGNQFVWIPVPKNGFIKGENGTNVNDVEIKLDRYTFDTNGVATAQGTKTIGNYHEELSTSTVGNTTAKDIDKFIESVGENEGYYIGRYEARQGTSGVTLKATDTVYNNVKQSDAATLCRNMYTSTEFDSDLMNSYAWDTATLFLQECGENKTYSRKTTVNTSLASKGTTTDVECNVYDMASNCIEWTTETSSNYTLPCVPRGGGYQGTSAHCTSFRYNSKTSYSDAYCSYRPLLYL